MIDGKHKSEAGASATGPDVSSDAVDIFAPGADDEEKALRRRLTQAHATGSARAARSRSDYARSLWSQAAQVASGMMFERASKHDLNDALRALSMMFCAANVFERIEGGGR